MTALVVQQMILGSFGVGVISVLALLLRSTARHDAVLRYRILLVFLPLALLIVPLQIAVAGLTPGWTRPPLEPVAALLPAVQWPAWLRPPETNLGAAAFLPETPQPGGAAVGRPVTRTQAGLGPGVLVAGYGAGVLVVLALGAPRVRAARRVLRDCRSITDPATRAVWEDVARAVGARGPIRLLQCARLSVPACWGGWRPAVILPPDALAAFGEANLRCAIHHELLHLRRRDSLAGVVELALVVGFWFHPLVWLYTRALAQDRELSCDALVVRATHKPRTYALALLEYCEKTLRPAAAAPLAGFGSVVTMQRRLKMIERAQTPVSRGRRCLVPAWKARARRSGRSARSAARGVAPRYRARTPCG